MCTPRICAQCARASVQCALLRAGSTGIARRRNEGGTGGVPERNLLAAVPRVLSVVEVAIANDIGSSFGDVSCEAAFLRRPFATWCSGSGRPRAFPRAAVARAVRSAEGRGAAVDCPCSMAVSQLCSGCADVPQPRHRLVPLEADGRHEAVCVGDGPAGRGRRGSESMLLTSGAALRLLLLRLRRQLRNRLFAACARVSC